jgi:hypothetical protein
MKLQRQSSSSEYICPITNRTIQIAVMASDNHYYDEFAIKRWLFLNLNSPCTHQLFAKKELVRNREFEKELDLYVKKNEVKFSTITYQDFVDINPSANIRERYCKEKNNYHILQSWIYDEETIGKNNVKVMQKEISTQLIRVLLKWRKELEILSQKLGTKFNPDGSIDSMDFNPKPLSNSLTSTPLSKLKDTQLKEIESIAQISSNFQCSVAPHYLGKEWPLAMIEKDVNKSLIDFEWTFNKSLMKFLGGLAEPLQLLTKYYVSEMPKIKKRNIEFLKKLDVFCTGSEEEKSIVLLEKNSIDKEIAKYIKNVNMDSFSFIEQKKQMSKEEQELLDELFPSNKQKPKGGCSITTSTLSESVTSLSLSSSGLSQSSIVPSFGYSSPLIGSSVNESSLSSSASSSTSTMSYRGLTLINPKTNQLWGENGQWKSRSPRPLSSLLMKELGSLEKEAQHLTAAARHGITLTSSSNNSTTSSISQRSPRLIGPLESTSSSSSSLSATRSYQG